MSLRKTVQKTLVKSGATRAAAWLSGPKIVILRYHSIQAERKSDHSLLSESNVHTAEEMDQHMAYVATSCDPVTMDDIHRFLSGGTGLPQRPVAVTIDDGFYDSYSLAAPILDKYGIKGAFYVITSSPDCQSLPWFCRTKFAFGKTTMEFWRDPTDGDRYDLSSQFERKEARHAANRICARLTGAKQVQVLSQIESELQVQPPDVFAELMMRWDDIRALKESGHIVGSHTVSHPNLTLITGKELARELTSAKKRISEEVGDEIDHFSFPNPIIQPHWNETVVEALRVSGYSTGVTSTSGPVHVDNANQFALARMAAPRLIDDFVWSVEASFAGRIF